MKLTLVAASIGLASLFAISVAAPAVAYDGTKCKAPGNCWEPKPGFPEKIAGTKYDNKLDPKEVAKQGDSEKAMMERNAKRVANFRKTGKFVYDVSKISQ